MPFPFIIVSFVPETKNNKTMTTSLDAARPLGSMTIGEFLEMFDEHLHTTNLQTAHVQTGATPKHLVYGLRGIQELLGCSHKSAQYYKDHVIREAVSQNGRKIVVDADQALKLFNQRRTAK